MLRLLFLASLLILTGCGTAKHIVDTPPDPKRNQMDVSIGSYRAGWENQHVLITVSQQNHAALAGGHSIDSITNEPSELPEAYNEFLERMNSQYGLMRVVDWPLASIGIHCLVFQMNTDTDTQELISELAKEPEVETAQLMQAFHVQSSNTYDDPYLPLQHGIRTMSIDSTHLWAKGAGVRVAIIDTGMELSHQDLTANVEMARNFVDKDELGFSLDKHGTAVAGVIAASANNGAGMVGMAPDSKVIALKACWQDSRDNPSATCNTITLAKALNFSILNGVAVINMSLAGPRDALLERLVKAALEKNIIVVGAVGDEGVDQFPTAVPGTIAVMNMGESVGKAINAPGLKIISTVPENNYELVDGSSFSAAHISGLAAILRELKPSLTPYALLALLQKTTDEITGTVNACRASALLMQFDLASCDD